MAAFTSASPSDVFALNFSAVWRLFVPGFGIVLGAKCFGTQCHLGRIVSKAIAAASLSSFMFEAWE